MRGERGGGITFHVALTLKYEEGVTSASAFFVANDTDALDDTIMFELACKVVVCCCFVLGRNIGQK